MLTYIIYKNKQIKNLSLNIFIFSVVVLKLKPREPEPFIITSHV